MPEVPSVDTSIYKNALPVGKSALDVAHQLGGMEQQKTQIDQSKLKLMNDRYQIIINELSTLYNNPNANRETLLNKMNTLSKMGLVPQNMLAEFATDIPQDQKQIQPFLKDVLYRAASVMEKVRLQAGQYRETEVGGQIIPSYESPTEGVRGANIPPYLRTEPPTISIVETDPNSPNYGQSKTLGPRDYPGAAIPTAPQFRNTAPITPVTREPLPVAPQQVVPATPLRSQRMGEAPIEMGAPAPQQPLGMPTSEMQAPRQPQAGLPAVAPPQRQSGGYVTGLAPGEAGLMESSVKSYVNELEASKNYQREVFPLKEAYKALEALGTKGTGPGTDTINYMKSFILSNVPGVNEDSFKGLSNIEAFDKAKKYLTDYVNITGNSGTNDKLAAAFEGNASVGISNASAISVVKSALALRNQKQAMVLEFQKSGLPGHQFSKWASQWVNDHDPRGFAVSMMTNKKSQDVLKQQFDKSNKEEQEKYLRSAELAKQMGL